MKRVSMRAFFALCVLCCSHVGQAFFVPSRAPSPRFVLRETPSKAQGGGGENLRPRINYLPGPDDTTEEKIRSLFVLFNNALATQNPKLVTKRYAQDAVLLPSANGEALMDTPSIEGFYEKYLLEHPQKRIVDGRIRIGHGWAEDAGVCEILTNGGKCTKARYSFVYVWEVNQWKILHHHTSFLGLVNDASSSKSSPPPPPPPMLSSGGPMTKQRVQNLFQLLQDSFEIRDAELVARRFSHDALFLPLDVYDSHKLGYQQIKDYFEEFLLGQPSICKVERVLISIDSSSIQPKWAKDTGTFQITFHTDGSTLDARYTIDYIVDEAGIWKISYFSISPLPKDWDLLRTFRHIPSTDSSTKEYSGSGPTSTAGGLPTTLLPAVTEEEVRGWFQGWNGAMATGDPEAVASLYAPDAVMMTTASGTPKASPQEIKDFYQLFLWNGPSAKVLQSFVTISSHWCKDVGVLEYTMKNAGGKKVRERYSFLYVHNEEGGWKIAHHHSSLLPGDIKETGSEIREDPENHFFE